MPQAPIAFEPKLSPFPYDVSQEGYRSFNLRQPHEEIRRHFLEVSPKAWLLPSSVRWHRHGPVRRRPAHFVPLGKLGGWGTPFVVGNSAPVLGFAQFFWGASAVRYCDATKWFSACQCWELAFEHVKIMALGPSSAGTWGLLSPSLGLAHSGRRLRRDHVLIQLGLRFKVTG